MNNKIRTPTFVDFNQLILEPINSPIKRWIHVSYKRSGKNRHELIDKR